MPYFRPIGKTVLSRISEPRKAIQVLAGPRQVGKTTLIKLLLKKINTPYHYASADLPTINNLEWIRQQWDIARSLIEKKIEPLLILDEIQKIPGWSNMVKALWDEDSFNDTKLKVVLLGSSPLLIQQGLTESLAGRFEIIPITHWNFSEMKEAFDWSLEKYIYFGGYPGSAEYIDDEKRWKEYILHSLIETTLSRDILLMSRIDKPALLRQLFQLGCHYSSQILSYQKMLGQLHDAGNATTLAHYLQLLSGAGLLTGIEKYAGSTVRKKASSPKLQVLNMALISAQNSLSFKEALKNREYWGRLVESAVGAYLYNLSMHESFDIYYWRERHYEIDFVLEKGRYLSGLEIKSGNKKVALPGFKQFQEIYSLNKLILIGGTGIKLEDFFKNGVKYCF